MVCHINFYIKLYIKLTNLAVLFEFERQKNATRDDPTTEQFIRAVVNEPEAGLIIVCFSEQQARKFLNLRFIELDMTFKRIHGVIHEIVFSTYLGDSEGNAGKKVI